eukprot:6192182-Pleurochrysis_carterae.AAC.2
MEGGEKAGARQVEVGKAAECARGRANACACTLLTCEEGGGTGGTLQQQERVCHGAQAHRRTCAEAVALACRGCAARVCAW